MASRVRARELRADGEVRLSPVERMLLDIREGDEVEVTVEGRDVIIRKARGDERSG